MRSKILAIAVISLLLMISVFAIEPPSWINLGEISYGSNIRDIIEISNYNVILACGWGSGGGGGSIWRSTDGGQSWSRYVLYSTASCSQLKRDSIVGRIWAVKEESAIPLVYSDDVGVSWNNLSGPSTNPAITGYTIELVGNYLYFGGSVGSPYSISLYRINKITLQWEMVTQYPQCNQITRLKYHNGKLLVFAKDKTQSLIRIFSHTLSELDNKAKRIGEKTFELDKKE